MPTIPTGKMERELRRLYFRWLHGLGEHTNMDKAVDLFERQSVDLIERMGGRTASLGALADFPVPKRLDLSPHIGTIYSDMKQAAIQAGIQAGLQATDVARAMMRHGMDTGFHRVNRLARTETVNAYWKNAWDSIEGLDLVMVWGSEDGPRTCKWCRERDGMIMTSSELRDHPNGRCTPLPTLRSQVDYKGSVGSNGNIYQDPEWVKAKPQPISAYPEADWDDYTIPDTLGRTAAAKAYVSEGYSDMNRVLRQDGGQVYGVTKAQHTKILKHVDSLTEDLMKGQTTKGMQVHRGTTANGAGRMFDIEGLGVFDKPSLDQLQSKIGSSVVEKGFTSTWVSGSNLPTGTRFIDKAEVMFNINLPARTRGSKMTLGTLAENEFLLPPGSEYLITDVRDEGGRFVVDLLLVKQKGVS